MIWHILRWPLCLVGLLLLLVIGAIALIQTGPGKRILGEQLSSRLSTADTDFEISGIEGWIPLDMRIEGLQLTDRDGTWLKLEDVKLDWSPGTLVKGRLQIDEISAHRIEVMRSPVSDGTPEPPSDDPFRLPELPTSLPPITVERLTVPEILLGAPFLGEPATFSLEGSVQANDEGDAVMAALNLERTDQQSAFIKLEATADLNPAHLDLNLQAGESGGMIKALTGRPEAGDASLSLVGVGPLEDWTGRLVADADGLAKVEADLALALIYQPRMTIDGIMEPSSGILPPDLAPLIGERISVDLDVVQLKAQALDLKKVAIDAALASLEVSGTVGFDEDVVALEGGLTVPHLAPIGPLANAELAGAADATFEVTGALSEPKGRIELKADKLAFDGRRADRLQTAVDWATTAALTSDNPAFDIAINGQASGLAIPDVVLPAPDLGWQAKLALPLKGEIGIEQIRIDHAGTSLAAAGKIDQETLDGAFDLTLDAASLKRLLEPYGQPVDGKGLIKAAIQLSDQAQSIDVDLDASLEDLAGLPSGAEGLLGGQARIEAEAALDPTRTLSVERLTIDGRHIALGGQGSLALDQEDIKGQLNLVLPELAVLGPLLPENSEGAIDLKADFAGNLKSPEVNLSLGADDLLLAGEPITALGITAAGRDLIDGPNGDLSIDVTARDTPAALKLAYRLVGDSLDLSKIALSAPETEIGGDLKIALDRTLVSGTLEGSIAALGALESLLQQKIDGSVDIAATLTPDGDRQNADVTLQARTISGDFGAVRTVDAEATIADAIGQPQIDAKGTVTGFEQGETRIDALTLTANGAPTALDLDFSLAGEVLQTLELTGRVAAGFDDGIAIGVERLEGAFAGEPLRLSAPLAFRQAGNDIQLSNLDLRLGDASLKGDVELGETSVQGTIDLSGLPLSWSEVFGGPSLSGAARANVDLSGSPSNPKITASLNVEDALGEGVTPSDLPLDLSLNALIDQGRLAADLEASGVTRQPVTGAVSLPISLSLSPFAFDLPKNGELDGRINAEVELANVADILALDDQEMRGTLFADIDIGGTLEAPRASGPVRLDDGAYENGATGTDLRDLKLVATASSERIEITEFSGNTGKKRGSLAASGWVELVPDQGFPLSVTLTLDDARLVNREDVDGRISGTISMTGNLNEAAINGDLKVERAEISLPDGGGPNLPDIEVTEVGGRIVNPPEEEQTEAEQPFDPTLKIKIELPNKIYVRGRGLDSEWQGDLDISGRASDPIIVGTLSVKEGFFDFLDKRFDLELGEINFSGATPPNPIIAIEAAAEDDDFRAIIKLNGAADDPQFLLESEPPLPQDEVLARLLFNRDLSEIGAVEAGKLAIAANKLRGGGGGFDVFSEIRGALNIDTLDVVSDEEGESRVKAGKYLNDDVYVEVERGAADESGRARIEIELLPNIAVEAEASENADSGVGIKWKFDY